MRELEFVKYLGEKFTAGNSIVKGIGDDAAVLRYTSGKYLLLACDMVVEGTHFTPRTPPRRIGWKAVAVNLSDIAAMGGIPRYALLSCGIPRSRGPAFLKGLVRGIEEICRKFNVRVVGGDTNNSRTTTLAVTIVGEVEKKNLVTRSGARPGDLIFVTGTLGEGAIKHLSFMPRIKEARTLVENFRINSMIDLSDGLAMDLNRLAAESAVGARIYKSLLPVSFEKERPFGWLKRAISSGEDFELLFTATRRMSRKIIMRMGEKGGLPITLVGEVVKRRFGVRLVEEDGKEIPIKPEGFSHL